MQEYISMLTLENFIVLVVVFMIGLVLGMVVNQMCKDLSHDYIAEISIGASSRDERIVECSECGDPLIGNEDAAHRNNCPSTSADRRQEHNCQ